MSTDFIKFFFMQFVINLIICVIGGTIGIFLGSFFLPFANHLYETMIISSMWMIVITTLCTISETRSYMAQKGVDTPE